MSRPMWDYLIPLPECLIVTMPVAIGRTTEKKTESGLYLPSQSEWTRKSYGMVAKVLKAGANVADTYPPGSSVLISEHAGMPIYGDEKLSRAATIWAEDVQCKVDNAYWDEVAGIDPEAEVDA